MEQEAGRGEARRVPQVPDHEILRLLGRGAYGEVWMARSVTGALRAVKVVWRSDYEDEAQFVREFEGVLAYEPIARSLPGLVHILHIGRREGDFPYYYYVMELADDAYTGIHIEPDDYEPRTLRSDMRLYGNRPMPADYVVEVGIQISRALEGLHAHDLTHRDVKPENILFVHGRAKLADVGLVGRGGLRSDMGTQGYMPPEGAGSPRADVYALAMVLYEMATGRDRLDFPELPLELPEGTTRKRWQLLNDIICAAAGPRGDKRTIASAYEFSERLDALRHFEPGRGHRHAHPLRRLAVVAAVGVLLPVVGYFLLPAAWQGRVQAAWRALGGAGEPAVQPPVPAPSPVAAEKPGLLVTSVPAGAGVYREDGSYADDTPCGPLPARPGEQVRLRLHKEGYADLVLTGRVPSAGVLTLEGRLNPLRPPVPGREWVDALGMAYAPEEEGHLSVRPVSAEAFERFSAENPGGGYRAERCPRTGCALTSQAAVNDFALWLSRLCEERGLLLPGGVLVPVAEVGTARGADVCGYRLRAVPARKVPIRVFTNPAGAMVSYNGVPLGVTPLRAVSVPLGPFYLEVRMPGYAAVRRSGLSPKGLSLNLNLVPNNSVTYGREWTNSLGMRMVPIAPGLMACGTETRVGDYRAFCAATGHPAPRQPDFEQNEHHPVVLVSRADAEAFAHWLTVEERERGLIQPTDSYRLPSDEEWSRLAGVSSERGETPYERRQAAGNASPVFPWGMKWPPQSGSGNFADVSCLPFIRANRIISGYEDGVPFTAPVGSFPPNALGLRDVAGNVQEWVSGEYGGPPSLPFRSYAVARGGDYSSFRPAQLSSSSRTPHPADTRSSHIGFRLVLEHRE